MLKIRVTAAKGLALPQGGEYFSPISLALKTY